MCPIRAKVPKIMDMFKTGRPVREVLAVRCTLPPGSFIVATCEPHPFLIATDKFHQESLSLYRPQVRTFCALISAEGKDRAPNPHCPHFFVRTFRSSSPRLSRPNPRLPRYQNPRCPHFFVRAFHANSLCRSRPNPRLLRFPRIINSK